MPRSRWHGELMEAFFFATHAWELQAEAETFGYKTEMAEYAAVNPRPQLKHFMIHLSHGQAE